MSKFDVSKFGVITVSWYDSTIAKVAVALQKGKQVFRKLVALFRAKDSVVPVRWDSPIYDQLEREWVGMYGSKLITDSKVISNA